MSRAGARRAGPGLLARLGAWVAHHGHSLFSSLGRLSRTPLATAMTLGVIGIALALPAGLHLLVDNARRLGGDWDAGLQVSVFLEHDLPAAAVTELAQSARNHELVAAVRIITPEEAIEEFREHSGFGAALDALGDNPLPAVLVLTPATSVNSPGQLASVVDELGALEGVAFVQLDTQWLQRLFALLALLERAIFVVAVLLGIAVVVTVGNTIRLDIQHRRQEIEVIKLIGGSDAFIRRPFLYTGFWYGVGGALAASILLGLAGLALGGPVARFAGLYGSTWSLAGLGFGELALLAGTGALLGWAGSWLAVGRHLRDIEPS